MRVFLQTLSVKVAINASSDWKDCSWGLRFRTKTTDRSAQASNVADRASPLVPAQLCEHVLFSKPQEVLQRQKGPYTEHPTNRQSSSARLPRAGSRAAAAEAQVTSRLRDGHPRKPAHRLHCE